MRPPTDYTRIIARKRYSTETATLLAGDDYFDGHNFERHGTNAFLYRTPRGYYFIARLSQWQGHSKSLEPVTVDAAVEFFEGCPEGTRRVSFETAFPGVVIEEA